MPQGSGCNPICDTMYDLKCTSDAVVLIVLDDLILVIKHSEWRSSKLDIKDLDKYEECTVFTVPSIVGCWMV